MGGECPNCGAECIYCDDAETDYEGERVARLEAELAAERAQLEDANARLDALVDALVNNKSQGLLGELIAEVRKARLEARK